MKYDIIIIGAGVSGAAVAREISRYKAKVCVLEKEEDVCCGTSKANSGIVHAGYDAEPGTLKAKLNVEGNAMMEELSRELDFPFKRTGSLVICRDEKEISSLQKLYDRGIANGVPNMQILNHDEVLSMEPNVTDDTAAALYAPTAGIVCPFGLNIAMAENANTNGVEFHFDTEVTAIGKTDAGYRLTTNRGTYDTRYVVNAAGVYADIFHNMVSGHQLHITPRRGDYCLLDKSAGGYVSRTIFALPSEKFGKGILVTPTIHGNILVGPTAIDVESREEVNTTRRGIDELIDKAGQNVKNLPIRQTITSFAGLRACEDGREFIIGEVKDAPGFIDCAGIESPGLTSSPAIGVKVAEMLRNKMNLQPNPDFHGKRKGLYNPNLLSDEERNELIQKEPAYGNIICRCEMISEGEILEAIRRPLGAKSLDGVKRRTRAGMGRCQSGFCSPRTMEILARETGKSILDITKSGGNSKLVVCTDKDSL